MNTNKIFRECLTVITLVIVGIGCINNMSAANHTQSKESKVKKNNASIKPVLGNDNFIVNSGFENYQNGILKSWITAHGDEADYDVVSKDVPKGKYALRINGSTKKKFSIRITDIPLQKNFQYRLSAKIKSKDFLKPKQGFMALVDRKWEWQNKRMFPSKPNFDWMDYSDDFVAPKTGFYKFVIFKYHTMQGDLYFDDISLKRLYYSAGIKFDFSNQYVVGNGSLKAKLINCQHENGSFSVKVQLTSAIGKQLVFNETKMVEFNSDEQNKTLNFDYNIEKPGYYNLECNVLKNGKLVDKIAKQIKFVTQIGITLIKPSMRKLYKFSDTKNLITEITFNRQVNKPCVLELLLTKRGNSDTITRKHINLSASKTTRFTTDISALPFGRYDILAILRDHSSKLISTSRHPLDIINPNRGVAIDKNHNLIVNGKLFFPWGFTGNMVAHKEFKRLKAAGFNVLMFYAPNGVDAYRKYLDKLHESGLKGIPYIARLRRNPRMLKQVIKDLRDHPALLAYDIADEPGGQDMDQFYNAYNIITDLDPYHPVMAIMADHNTYHKYVNIVDVFAVDPYTNTIPKRHQSRVYNCVKKALDVTKKTVWDIPPTFGRSKYWQVPFVAPTPNELKNDFYLALAGGAKGLIGYTYNNYCGPKSKDPKQYLNYKVYSNRTYMPENNPHMWKTCKNMTRDLNILKPFIRAPQCQNEILLGTNKKVFSLYKIWGSKRGGLIVNSEPQTVTTTVKLPDSFSGKLKLPIGGGNINAKNGEFKITLKALGQLYFEY
jgi:carbohydrate binding protein with CBM4/9 domain